MRIAEMKSREDFQGILVRTLERGLSIQRQTTVKIEPLGTAAAGQVFYQQDLLNGIFAANPSTAVRRFLADGFKYTPRRRRKIPQYILATALCTRLGLRLSSTAVFSINPAEDCPEDLLICPGNQRVRLFNFRSGRTRVLLKDGFSARTMLTEIHVRAAGEGPFLGLTDWDHSGEGLWFEEDIIDGFCLPRCPPWAAATAHEATAVRDLQLWLHERRSTVPATDYCAELSQRLEQAWHEVERLYPDVVLPGRGWHRRLLGQAMSLGQVVVSQSHGDFQPGNIMVDTEHRRVLLIDWEHSATRSMDYDLLVFGLHTRQSSGLADRLLALLSGAELPQGVGTGALDLVRRRDEELRPRVALMLAEDLLWYLCESTAGAYRTLPEGLRRFTGELRRLGPNLEKILP